MTVIEKELDVYENRCERYPNNLIFRYELAQRYQLKGDYGEAIKQYQVAKADPRKRGMCLINLGECFRAIKQFHLAMNHFEQAVQEIPDREQEYKKLAYYRAGKLAMGLKDLPKAEKYLTTLASMDYTYRDTSDLLERLHRMLEDERKKGGGGTKRQRARKRRDKDDEEKRRRVGLPAVYSFLGQPLWTNWPDFGKMVDSPRAGWVLPRWPCEPKHSPK